LENEGRASGFITCHLLDLPSEGLAALLFAQLEEHERIQARRRAIWQRYADELSDWAKGSGVRLPVVPANCEQAFHLFYLVMPSLEERQALIAHLRAQGIHAIFHYLPLHLSEMGQRFGGRPGDCPVTETVSDRLVRLPLFFDLSDTDQSWVIEATRSFHGHTSVPLYDPLPTARGRVAA
jgi:dTDP-4-amino-4,6-dideoxygalactose transaminase